MDFSRQNLQNSNFLRTNLSHAVFHGSDLSESNFQYADFHGADLSDAIIRGAILAETNFSKEQLYATASYQNKDLRGVIFYKNNLTDWSFSGQDLTDTYLGYATLSGADFTDSTLKGARLNYATYYGFTKEQLYSTKSYKNKDMSGINFSFNNLNGWDFSGQNLIGANFRGANVSGANFTFADLRKASDWNGSSQYMIAPDGTMWGMRLLSDEMMVIPTWICRLHYQAASL